jgi:hypothetical protein
LKSLQRQTEASIAMTTETFRPILEVVGGSLCEESTPSNVDFVNKGNGAALDFRWRVDEEPERWGGYTSNIIAPQEFTEIIATRLMLNCLLPHLATALEFAPEVMQKIFDDVRKGKRDAARAVMQQYQEPTG